MLLLLLLLLLMMMMIVALFAAPQDSSYNDHLKSLHVELRKKHRAGELDAYCLYV